MSTLFKKFNEIYNDNRWGSKESLSGSGSELTSTAKLRNELPFLFNKYNIKSMLDIPCGDFNWMKQVDLTNIDYTGADIVVDLINKNRKLHPEVKFDILDVTEDVLPQVDLVFVRDCLGHLSNANVIRAIENIKRSKSKYLLTTSFTKYTANTDIEDGKWRPINLLVEPFKLKPEYLINEDCKESYPHYSDKCMILFNLL